MDNDRPGTQETGTQTTQEFDVIIIGAGPGGYSTALRAAQLGKRVALVERAAVPGGVCLQQGCVPSKALLTAARTVRDGRQASLMGLSMPLQSLDLGTLFAYKDNVVNQMTRGLENLLRTRGVRLIQGTATLRPGQVVQVETAAGRQPSALTGPAPVTGPVSEGPTATTTIDGQAAVATAQDGDSPTGGQPDQALSASASRLCLHAPDIVLATGSRPRQLPGTPFSHKAIISSEGALSLTQIPQSATIVGSGPVGLEFATLWRSFGAEVTILEAADRLLPYETDRVSALVARQLKREGIDYVTGAVIDSVDEGVNQFATVRYHKADSPSPEPSQPSPLTGPGPAEDSRPDGQSISAQFVLVAIGRTPNTDVEWWDECGIQLDGQGLVVTDPYGRTSVEGVWALGDITPGKQLAHRAFAQGLVVAEAIAGIQTQPVDDHNVPSVVFATSEVASVGYTLEEALKEPAFAEVEETVLPTLGNSRVVMLGQSGSISLVCGTIDGEPTRRVLGVHMVGPGVSELVAEAEQLVGNRVPLHDAARLVHPHPTLSESLGEALLSADGRPLHSR